MSLTSTSEASLQTSPSRSPYLHGEGGGPAAATSFPQPTSSILAPRLLAGLIIFVTVALRLAYLASPIALDLAPDEAHYWDWSRHLDWSYYSKGPMVAYLIGGSCCVTESWAQAVLGNAMFSVRLPAVLCGALLLAGLYVLTALVFRRETLALGVMALAATMPAVAAASIIMTIDAPYLCCWTWALVFGHLAVIGKRRWAWPMTGLMIALGLLAKQTMVLWVPSLILFLVFTPRWRGLLLSRGFWIMAFVGALGSVPMIVWNSQHDWVTFRHLLGHSGFHESAEPIHWLGPVKYVGLQFALLLGYWFLIWCAAMWAFRPWRTLNTIEANQPIQDSFRYLWWMSAPTFLFFLGFSWKNGGGEPNWPVTAYLSGLVLSASWLAERLTHVNPWQRHSARLGLAAIVAVSLALTLLVHDVAFAYPLLSRFCEEPSPHNLTPIRKLDPTSRLRGWRTLAAEVDRIREELRRDGIEAEIAADRWWMPGELGVYCQGHPTVYSFGPVYRERHSQYDLWRPNPVDDSDAFVGKTFILVVETTQPLDESFDQLGERRLVVHNERGQPVSRWFVTIARGYRGCPSIPNRGDF